MVEKGGFEKWWEIMKNQKKKIAIALFFLIVAVVLYSLSGDYVTDHQGSVVSPDLILDHFGPYNLAFIFIWLFLAAAVIYFAYPMFVKPKELPYMVNMFSLFVVIRAGFIIFTHLRPPYDAVHVTFPWFLQFLNFSNDLFFSGHAGFPFLGFLIFREHHKGLSYFMLATSIILGITVLLMHVHYSIDVLSAYFITYGIYEIGKKFIKK
jgi:tryptophan-rich sensory protein